MPMIDVYSATGTFADKSELAKFFAQVEIEFGAVKMELAVFGRKVAFNRQFDRAESQKETNCDSEPNHSSFP